MLRVNGTLEQCDIYAELYNYPNPMMRLQGVTKYYYISRLGNVLLLLVVGDDADHKQTRTRWSTKKS